jgi:hypothetical protein
MNLPPDLQPSSPLKCPYKPENKYGTNIISYFFKANILNILVYFIFEPPHSHVTVLCRYFKGLRTDILRLQGFKTASNSALDVGLGPIRDAFPNASFPLGAIHEFLSAQKEDAASTVGFIAGLLSSFVGSNGAILWISSSRTIFPPALISFGRSDRFIFIDLQKKRMLSGRWMKR